MKTDYDRAEDKVKKFAGGKAFTLSYEKTNYSTGNVSVWWWIWVDCPGTATGISAGGETFGCAFRELKRRAKNAERAQ